MGIQDLDAHEQPSQHMRAEWKGFSRQDVPTLVKDPRIDDPRAPLEKSGFQIASNLPQTQIANAFSQLGEEYAAKAEQDVPALFHPILPGTYTPSYTTFLFQFIFLLMYSSSAGLLIFPSLIPPAVQQTLMDRMIHRDLSNPKHQTNLHLHFNLPYPEGTKQDESSFFSLSPESPPSFIPKDPDVHKPLSVSKVMERRLHWVTLGGQYDWTNRVYPDELPQPFPDDLSRFLEGLFPETVAQAAILNFYSPGDTMMMHRDVSEETDKGLISLSFGCDCLFMIAPNNMEEQQKEDEKDSSPEGARSDEKQYLLLRLRSGDAIYMTQESRFAWHGVPKVLKGTCPDFLEDWPAREDGTFNDWRGWLRNKRINLNVRQMRD